MSSVLNETLKYTAMILLVLFGLALIYQGIVYINMKNNNPELPRKVTVLGVIFIIVGIIDIILGIAHIYL